MIVYVAAPYSNVEDKEELLDQIAKFNADYMVANPGEYLITGLVHHYALKHNKNLGSDWKFWKTFCIDFLDRVDKLIVLQFPGWDTSRGVQEEIEYAQYLALPIEYHTIAGRVVTTPVS